MLVLIREFDEGGYWQLPGLCSCAHWLNFQCGIGMNAAREKVRVAHALAGLPKISAAFARGELSWSKVRAMTRIADAGNEDYLLMVARHGTAFHIEKLVSLYRRCKRSEEVALSNLQYAHREVSLRYEPDGSVVLQARLPAEQGALLQKALWRAVERREDERRQCDDVSAGTRVREPFAVSQADALAEMAEAYLASEPTTSTAADRYQVVVHVSAETLRAEGTVEAPAKRSTDGDFFERERDRPQLEDGGRVSAETARRLACDCSRIPLFEDEEGEPLAIGRKSRSVPPAIRRVLKARDDGCRFPGCTHTRFVDAHHIEHWADGGEISVDNLVMLCRHHHRLVHEGGYACERARDGRLVFRDQRRQELQVSVPLVPVDTDRAFGDWMLQKVPDLAIDEHTCVPEWHAGETIDWDFAVSLLFDNPGTGATRH